MRYLVVWYAMAMHLIWSILLLFSTAPIKVTGINLLYRIFPNRFLLSALLTAASVLAFISVTKLSKAKALFFMLPQQFLLVIAGIAGLTAIINSAFADGVMRPRAFLAADKIGLVLIAIFHTMYLITRPKVDNKS